MINLIQHIGQTRDEAVDAYGRNLIGGDDLLIINRIVAAAKAAGDESACS